MAKRFHSHNILTNKGNVDVIEIWDGDFSGTSTAFRAGEIGYRLIPEGSQNDRFNPVVPTTLEFEMIIENATHRALITDLTTSPERRFKIKLTRNGNLRYAGNVLVDIGSYEDISYPYAFTVKASDLGPLATIDYKDTSTAYDGWETYIQHVVRALDKTELPEFAWASGTMLTTCANWYEDSMTTGAAQDPLALTRCHHRAFYQVESTGKYTYMSTLDVLRHLMLSMGCRLMQSAGQFRIFQITAYNEATPRLRHYDKDGTYTSNSAPTYTTTIDQTNAGARLAGGNFTWLPPLKEVKLIYKHRNWTNVIAGATLGDGVAFTGPELAASANPFNLAASLTVKRTLVNGSNATGSPYFEKYRFRFKVGSYYLKRNLLQIQNNTPQYEAASWSTSVSDYYFHFVNTGFFPALGGSGQITSTYDFSIPPFPATGASEFDAASAGFVNASGSGVGITLGAALEITGYVAMNFGDEVTDTEYTVSNPDTSANSVSHGIVLNIGAGTSENSIGRLQVSNGTTWSDANATDGWTIGGTGTEKLLQNLLIEQIMAGQRSPIEKMVTTVGYTNFEPHERLNDGTSIWAFLQGEYIAKMDDWRGEWYYITYDPVDILADDPAEIPSGGGITPIPFPTGPIIGPPRFPHTTPTVPDTPVPAPNPDFPPFDGLILGGISGNQTSTSVSQGAVTSIPVINSMVVNAYQAGQQITIIDPATGINQNFIVAANTAAGDTSISVTGYAINAISPNAYIVTTGANGVVQSLPSTTTTQAASSPWWQIFAQHWIIDNTNEFPYPIESPDVVMETNENAGNGATAGFRLDGDGVTSYSASSTTPGVKIGLDGKLYLANLDTGTGTVGLILEGGYVKQKTLSAGVTDHGALTGLSDDDHSIYALLAGRAGGQILIGGTAASNNLTLQSTTSGSRGYIICDDVVYLANVPTGTSTDFLVLESNLLKKKSVTIVTDHGALTGLSDDDHSIYAYLAGRSTGQTLIGGISSGGFLKLQSTSNATRGNVQVLDQLQLDTVNLAASTVTQALFVDSGVVKYRTVDNKDYVYLVAVPKGTAVTQTSGFDFNDAVWLVPNALNGASITRVDYAILNNTSTTGSLTVGFDHYNTSNSVVANNILSVTFNTSDVRKSSTSTQTLTAGNWMVASVSSTAGTLNGTVEGLIITIEITR